MAFPRRFRRDAGMGGTAGRLSHDKWIMYVYIYIYIYMYIEIGCFFINVSNKALSMDHIHHIPWDRLINIVDGV